MIAVKTKIKEAIEIKPITPNATERLNQSELHEKGREKVQENKEPVPSAGKRQGKEGIGEKQPSVTIGLL